MIQLVQSTDRGPSNILKIILNWKYYPLLFNMRIIHIILKIWDVNCIRSKKERKCCVSLSLNWHLHEKKKSECSSENQLTIWVLSSQLACPINKVQIMYRTEVWRSKSIITNLYVDRICLHFLWRESILVVNPMRKRQRELISKSSDAKKSSVHRNWCVY